MLLGRTIVITAIASPIVILGACAHSNTESSKTPSASSTEKLSNEQRLAKIGVTIRQWSLPTDESARHLLDQKSLTSEEKEELLSTVDGRFKELKLEKGYTARDLIVLHEDIPGFTDILGKFDKIHYHSDDEVRYILAGHGHFGFIDKDGTQFTVEVSAGDYINIPAKTEHWFEMKDTKRLKAVRYFTNTDGWKAFYTERKRQL